MSRGLGLLQRRVVDVLEHSQQVLTIEEIGTNLDRASLGRTEYEALRRALHSCVRRGLLADAGWRRGRRQWGTPAAVQREREEWRRRFAALSVASGRSRQLQHLASDEGEGGGGL